MKQYRLQLLAACLCSIFGVCLLGWVGDYDYCDQIILSMSQEQYDNVKDTLTKKFGKSPSEREIAHWWADHRNRDE